MNKTKLSELVIHYLNFAKIAIFFACNFITSFWFSKNQIWSLCQGYPDCSYPTSLLILTFLKSFCVSVLCYTMWHKFVNFCVKEKIESRFLALMFSPIILLLFAVKILIVIELILLLSAILIIHSNKVRLDSERLVDLLYFLFLFWSLLVFCEAFSPLYFKYSTTDLRGDLYRLPLFSNFFKAVIGAKHFSFSGVDYASWASVIHSPLPSPALLFQLLILLSDLPSLDVISFYKILLSVIFILFLVGSFSFYLLAYYGLKFNRGIAFFAGAGFIFGNYQFLLDSSKLLEGDGYIFLSSYALLPLALFLFTLAFRKKSYLYSILSGAALALPPFILPIHPEAIIYSAGIYFAVTFFFTLFHRDSSLEARKKFALLAMSLATFLSFFAFYFLPIFVDIFDGNMGVYGHKNSYSLQAYHSAKDYVPFLLMGVVVALGQLIFKKNQNGFIWGVIVTIFLFSPIVISKPDDLIYQIVSHFVSLHLEAHFRPLMFLAPLFILVGLYGVNFILRWSSSFSAESRAVKFFTNGLVVATICFCADFFPIRSLEIEKDNHCPYYITLQSNLSNYRGLQGDRANLPFIKSRLEKFESDLNKSSAQSYTSQYSEVLKSSGVATARDLQENQVIRFSDNAYKIIDGFYLNKNLNCVNELLDNTIPQKKILSLEYNLDGIYYSLNKNYERIFVDDRGKNYSPALGIGNGYLMHNNTLNADTRFIITYPTIHALYLTPKHYQNNQKEFRKYFHDDTYDVMSQKNMKFFDVAGIDIFTTSKGYKNNSNLVPIKISNQKIFGYENDFAIFRNKNSYGATYIVGMSQLVDKDFVQDSEVKIRDYFHEKLSFEDYVKTVKKLQEPIEKIAKKYDVVVEDAELNERYKNNKRSVADIAEIKNIAGNKIFIKASCAEEKCLLALNLAAFPQWKAFVNKDSAEIFRINLAFMGVEIPKGENGILFVCESYLTNDLLFLAIIIFLICLTHFSNFTPHIQKYSQR